MVPYSALLMWINNTSLRTSAHKATGVALVNEPQGESPPGDQRSRERLCLGRWHAKPIGHLARNEAGRKLRNIEIWTLDSSGVVPEPGHEPIRPTQDGPNGPRGRPATCVHVVPRGRAR